MNLMFRCCAVLCAAFVAACATGPTVAPAPAFDLAGRIGVRFQDRSFTSSVLWKQHAGSDEIWLTAPLGKTIAHLRADGDGATLTTADQRQYRAGSIESLTRDALGWRFPVAAMRYWVLGQPSPGMALASVERDQAGRITQLKQDDWQVAFSYAASAAARPARVEAVGAGAEIRFVIDEFTPQP